MQAYVTGLYYIYVYACVFAGASMCVRVFVFVCARARMHVYMGEMTTGLKLVEFRRGIKNLPKP